MKKILILLHFPQVYHSWSRYIHHDHLRHECQIEELPSHYHRDHSFSFSPHRREYHMLISQQRMKWIRNFKEAKIIIIIIMMISNWQGKTKFRPKGTQGCNKGHVKTILVSYARWTYLNQCKLFWVRVLVWGRNTESKKKYYHTIIYLSKLLLSTLFFVFIRVILKRESAIKMWKRDAVSVWDNNKHAVSVNIHSNIHKNK